MARDGAVLRRHSKSTVGRTVGFLVLGRLIRVGLDERYGVGLDERYRVGL